MKQAFIEKRFSEVAQQLIKASNIILQRYAAQGYDMSVRQLFYQLVSANVIPNRAEWYQKLGGIINDARLAGLVDWNMIVDRGRPLRKNTLWASPGDTLKAASQSFQYDRWQAQKAYIEVMVEKQALEGVLLPVCSKYGVGFTANKGYSSASALYETSLRIKKALAAGKEVTILYCGDHDPSGADMTRDIRDRLKLFCGCEIDVKRIALNKSQIDEYELPPNPAKMTDSRAAAYVAKHGELSWELDALRPNVLADLIKSAIKRRLDLDQWKRDGEKERLGKALILAAADALHRRFTEPKIDTIKDDKTSSDGHA